MTAARLLDALRSARSLLAITGAGVSAESGIPTYRGVAGLYNADDGEQVMRDLSLQTLRREPRATFDRVNSMREACAAADPNPAHQALAACESGKRVAILTQNIDGLHAAAGSSEVVEIHGNVFRMRCESCDHTHDCDRQTPPEWSDCPACGQAPLRHDVVLFNEMLPAGPLHRLAELVHDATYDVALLIGTTAMFPYIRDSALSARQGGALLAEINPVETRMSARCDLVVRAPAGEVLAPLLEDPR